MKSVFHYFRQFPHEKQLETKDCGPACIKIIARFYGRYFQLSTLRTLSHVSKEGMSVADLEQVFDSIGIKALAYKLTFEELRTKAKLPCVIHWQQDHFIVVYKITKSDVYVSDPSSGLIRYRLHEFLEGWSGQLEKGIVIITEPTLHFYKSSEHNHQRYTVSHYFTYFKPYKKNLFAIAILMLIVTVLQGFLPFLSRAVIDIGIQTSDLDFINLALIANITIHLIVLLSNIARDWILLHVTSRMNVTLLSDYLVKLLKLPFGYFESRLIGDILQRVTDHERIRSFVMTNSLNIIFSLLTFFIFGIILLVYNATIFYIFCFGNLIFLAWVLGFLRVRRGVDTEYFQLTAQNQSFWVEMVESIQEVKINNQEKHKRLKWEGLQAKLYRLNQRILQINTAQNLGGQFISQTTNLFITFSSVKSVLNGTISFGVMVSIQFIIGMLSAPITQLISFIQAAQQAKLSFARLNEIHSLADESSHESAHRLELANNRNLVIRNLSFQYSKNAPLTLKNINLVIPENKITAIVGDSGSGKTTLLRLLLRLYNPTYGDISLGNISLRNVDLHEWRKNCGVVMQDGKLFSDTILRNIVLDDDDVDFVRLKNAVMLANIALEIESFPNGYYTRIGASGFGLSGGQKQRLLIARALYKSPEFIFFDEATNALDALTEQAIWASLESLFRTKTAVIIAHRLSTVRKADQIVVLRNGIIAEVGNHHSLMQNEKGHYYQLVKTQLGENFNARVNPS